MKQTSRHRFKKVLWLHWPMLLPSSPNALARSHHSNSLSPIMSNKMTVPAAINNNLVAESDLDAALKALTRSLSSGSPRGLVDHEAAAAEYESFATSCRDSLASNIHRVVQPVSDEAFHLYIRANSGSVSDDDKDEEQEPRRDRLDDVPDDFDPEELLELEALQRVQQLRIQVREEATRVKTLRDSVLDRAVSLATRQVQLYRDNMGIDNSTQESSSTTPASYHSKLLEMEESLKQMQLALESTELELPDKLGNLQETIATIEASWNKPNLSKVEQAIVSKRDDMDVEDEDELKNLDTMDPEDRLARFLRE
jgi:hypothetical protein